MARAKKQSSAKSKKNTELASVSDPRAPLDGAAFLKAAQRVLRLLAADLEQRAKESPEVSATLQARHAAEVEARRTADAFVVWQQSFVEQVAAAWLLSCVFARVLEDRDLLGRARIGGPGATDSQHLFLELAPSLTERDYLLTVFRELARFPAARDLFDARHNPVWLLAPSAEATKELLALFRTPNANEPAFRFGASDTRFLGDLYQDLSEDVKKRFALLQTPRFVESFILDRTLERAIERFGLNETTLIDPTCGSGHFLLGAFERLFDYRLRAEPGLDPREAARKALDAVFGADINPYAVAIARFRLTLAYLEKAGFARLKDAPALPLHLVVADSLLHNPHLKQLELGDQPRATVAAWKGEEFALEDEAAARDVLHRDYTAVVGNPPYITVKDAVLRDRYRLLYDSAAGKYSLAAPFAERFFQLAHPRGAVGMITANSFMKREFGKKLIEKYLPSVNLDLVVNTSGAYIPGHGTPTVLLFGTQEPPQGKTVHTVLASRGEPATPAEAEQGLVWRSIADHWREVGFENDYISVMDVERASLAKHPWSLGGGGASELKEVLEERAEGRLEDVVESIGIASFTLEDDVFLRPADTWDRLNVPCDRVRPMVTGETIRDWTIGETSVAFFPYRADFQPVGPDSPELRHLWPWRTQLANSKLFGGKTKVEGGLQWFEYGRLTADKLRTSFTLAFAFVSTHNHFVLDRGGKVFNRTAPVIKLPESATEDDHYALLAYLNSSTACFWMKQVFFDKGNRGEGGGVTAETWEKFFEFDSTKLAALPLPAMTPKDRMRAIQFGRDLNELGSQREKLAGLSTLFGHVSAEDLPSAIEQKSRDRLAVEARIRGMQENLDWFFYRLFELSNDGVPEAPALAAGERPSDMLFAEAVTEGAVGARYFQLCRLPGAHELTRRLHGSGQPRWMAERLRAIAASEHLALLETPVFKRTYREGFREPDAERAFRDYTASVAERHAVQQASAFRARDAARGADLGSVDVDSILLPGSVPFLAAYRFTESGLAKHNVWNETWALQRRNDAGESVGTIPVPPKYDSKDYRDARYWSLRGKLDVPKERFISYPGCESDEDGEPVYGWAGWNHLQRAQALAALYEDRKQREGWSKERLSPILAGLLELIPWVKQWHNSPSEEYEGLRLGEYFESYLGGECRQFGLTTGDLAAWRPERTTRTTARRNSRPAQGAASD